MKVLRGPIGQDMNRLCLQRDPYTLFASRFLGCEREFRRTGRYGWGGRRGAR